MPRILFALVGSLGDVYPFLALAKALQCPAAGGTVWEVVVAAHPEFESRVLSHGFTFAPLKPSLVDAVKDTPEGRALTKTNAHGAVKAANEFFEPLFKNWHQDIKAAHSLHKPDLVVLTTFPSFCGLFAIGDTPYVVMHTVPGYMTGEIAPATAGLGLSLPFAFLNRFVWSMGGKVMVKMYGGALSTLGPDGGPSPMPAAVIEKSQVPILHVYSNALLPRCSDWPAQCHVTGALSFNSPRIAGVTGAGKPSLEPGKKDNGSQEDSSVQFDPPGDLANLLEDAGKNSIPVVYVGFGSMLAVAFEPPEATALLQKIVSALLLPSTPKCLGVIATSGLTETPTAPPDSTNGTKIHFSSIFIPHTWLFPRCSVIVHHGGAGTTHSSIRHSICQTGGISAAISVVIPCAVSSDQGFWGDIVYRTGLGPKPIRAKSVTIVNFGKVLAEVLQLDGNHAKGKKAAMMRKKAGEMAVRMKAEDGVGKAVDIIEAFAVEKKVPGLV